jgi:hypothetical protein
MLLILFLIAIVICSTLMSEASLLFIKMLLFISLPVLFFVYASKVLEGVR